MIVQWQWPLKWLLLLRNLSHLLPILTKIPAINCVEYGLDFRIKSANKPSNNYRTHPSSILLLVWSKDHILTDFLPAEVDCCITQNKLPKDDWIGLNKAASRPLKTRTNYSNERCNVFVVDCCVLHLRCARTISVMMTQPHQQNMGW